MNNNVHKDKTPGEIIKVDKNGIIVHALDGEIIIKSLQLEGKKKTTTSDIANSNQIKEKEVFK